MRLVAIAAGLIAVALGGCSLFSSANLSRDTVIAQAKPDGPVAYDVVKVDDAVVRTVLAHAAPPFHARFKPYQPPPAQKIEVGDRLSVVIWESSPEGLFGYSLWDTVNPEGLPLAGAAAAVGDLSTNRFVTAPAGSAGATAAQGLFPGPGGSASAGPGLSPDFAAAIAAAAPALSSNVSAGALAQTQAQPASPGGLASATGVPLANPGGMPSTAQLPGADLMALQALQQNAVASGLPRPPDSAQNLGEVGRPGTRIPVQEIGTDGTITVPYAGRITAVGRTPHEVEQAIERRLTGKAVDPQALVAVQRSPANAVTVAGEVIGGKRVPLSPAGERLLDVIAAAGGAQAPVHDTFVALSRDGVTATAPLAMLVDHPEENIFARPGDVLTLVRRPQTFSVFGATGKNAAITFDRDRLSLSEALAKSGGLLDDQADPRAVFLFRYEPDSVVQALGQPLATDAPQGVSPVAYRFDLQDAKTYLLAKQFPVRDKDIVFVANAEIQPVYRFFVALQNVTGPVITGFLTCRSGTGC